VPFQGVFFFGVGFPMALPWAGREVPPAGRQIWQKIRAAFLNKAERLIHGVPIAHNPEN
jgi:hypothetical protein